MVYRIRYCDGRVQHDREVLVEAHNTAEAMVKFCHAHAPGGGRRLGGARVSILPEPVDDPPADPVPA